MKLNKTYTCYNKGIKSHIPAENSKEKANKDGIDTTSLNKY